MGGAGRDKRFYIPDNAGYFHGLRPCVVQIASIAIRVVVPDNTGGILVVHQAGLGYLEGRARTSEVRKDQGRKIDTTNFEFGTIEAAKVDKGMQGTKALMDNLAAINGTTGGTTVGKPLKAKGQGF